MPTRWLTPPIKLWKMFGETINCKMPPINHNQIAILINLVFNPCLFKTKKVAKEMVGILA